MHLTKNLLLSFLVFSFTSGAFASAPICPTPQYLRNVTNKKEAILKSIVQNDVWSGTESTYAIAIQPSSFPSVNKDVQEKFLSFETTQLVYKDPLSLTSFYFKIGYKGANKECKRQIVLDQEIDNTGEFTAWMAVDSCMPQNKELLEELAPYSSPTAEHVRAGAVLPGMSPEGYKRMYVRIDKVSFQVVGFTNPRTGIRSKACRMFVDITKKAEGLTSYDDGTTSYDGIAPEYYWYLPMDGSKIPTTTWKWDTSQNPPKSVEEYSYN